VEESLDRASHSLQDLVAVALFGSASQAGEVPAGLWALGGPPCANAFWAAKRGVHDPQHGDLKRFIDDTELLAKALVLMLVLGLVGWITIYVLDRLLH